MFYQRGDQRVLASLCRTGDTAATEGEDKCWKILGRTSTDIIKSGGYKISALQIEDALLGNPKISNCAVLGTSDEALGESITAVISCDGEKVAYTGYNASH